MTFTLSIKDKIGLSAIAVMGRSVAEEAFLLTHPTVRTKNRASLSVMVSRWHHSPQAEAFIKSVRAGTATVTPSDEANDLMTREGIIDALDEEEITFTVSPYINIDEKRLYVLTWHSRCRQCKLMQIYLQMQKNNKLDVTWSP